MRVSSSWVNISPMAHCASTPSTTVAIVTQFWIGIQKGFSFRIFSVTRLHNYIKERRFKKLYILMSGNESAKCKCRWHYAPPIYWTFVRIPVFWNSRSFICFHIGHWKWSISCIPCLTQLILVHIIRTDTNPCSKQLKLINRKDPGDKLTDTSTTRTMYKT